MQFKKSLGQHFLIDDNIKRKIINLLNLKDDDTVLEIGPGEGALTDLIYKKCKKLILVEKDCKLGENLKRKFPDAKIFIDDFLKWDFNEFDNLKIIGNLPYNVSTQIIFKLLENRKKWIKGIFMVQKEVAQRIIANPGSKDYSILSVVCQIFCDVKKEFDVSPNCFIPKPKVYSSIIELKPKDTDIEEFENFLKFTKALFYARRKKLLNSLKKNPYIKFSKEFIGFVSKNFDENIRIEEINLTEIKLLFQKFKMIN